jgi:hypothetical protein
MIYYTSFLGDLESPSPAPTYLQAAARYVVGTWPYFSFTHLQGSFETLSHFCQHVGAGAVADPHVQGKAGETHWAYFTTFLIIFLDMFSQCQPTKFQSCSLKLVVRSNSLVQWFEHLLYVCSQW